MINDYLWILFPRNLEKRFHRRNPGFEPVYSGWFTDVSQPYLLIEEDKDHWYFAPRTVVNEFLKGLDDFYLERCFIREPGPMDFVYWGHGF